MKQRVTLALREDTVAYLDQIATQESLNRSVIVERIIVDYMLDRKRGELTRQAAEFFAIPESPEEREERTDWERLAMEVLQREP